MLIDAVGVTESLKTVSQPLERERAIGFDKLIEHIAGGRRDKDLFRRSPGAWRRSTASSTTRTARRIAKAAGGSIRGDWPPATRRDRPRHARAHRRRPRPDIGSASDAGEGGGRRVFDDPALRRLLNEVKQAVDIRIDTITTDAVVSSGYDDKGPARRPGASSASSTSSGTRWSRSRSFTAAACRAEARPRRRSRICARRCAARPGYWSRPTFGAPTSGSLPQGPRNPARALADIVMLVRYAIGRPRAWSRCRRRRRPLQFVARPRGERGPRLYRGAERLAHGDPRPSRRQRRNDDGLWWMPPISRRAAASFGRGRCSARDCRRSWTN